MCACVCVHACVCVRARVNRCKPGFFNLQQDLPSGCQPCFCFGHSVSCTSSSDHVAVNITSDFVEGIELFAAEFELFGNEGREPRVDPKDCCQCFLELSFDVLPLCRPGGLQTRTAGPESSPRDRTTLCSGRRGRSTCCPCLKTTWDTTELQVRPGKREKRRGDGSCWERDWGRKGERGRYGRFVHCDALLL